MKTLQEQINDLGCNAFIGVCFTVDKDSTLAYHVEDDEERMQPIDELIAELKEESEDLEMLKLFQEKGITEVVLIKGW